jgi:hypothetical protein
MKVQEEQDQDTVEGLANGKYRLPQGVKDRLNANEKSLTEITSSNDHTDEQRKNLTDQMMAQNARLRRLRTPIPPEEQAAAIETQRQKFVQTIPNPEDRNLPWQPVGKGGWQVARGYKPKVPSGSVSDAEWEDYLGDSYDEFKDFPRSRDRSGHPTLDPNAVKVRLAGQKTEDVENRQQTGIEAREKVHNDREYDYKQNYDREVRAERQRAIDSWELHHPYDETDDEEHKTEWEKRYEKQRKNIETNLPFYQPRPFKDDAQPQQGQQGQQPQQQNQPQGQQGQGQGQGQLPQINSETELKSSGLKSGSMFIGPDGKKHKVP